MEANSFELQRLDFAAKSLGQEPQTRRRQIVLSALSIIIVFLASISEAPPRETYLVRAIAAVAVLSALVSWLRPRLSLYSISAVFLSMAIRALLTKEYDRDGFGLPRVVKKSLQ
jgi:hypothetical protein